MKRPKKSIILDSTGNPYNYRTATLNSGGYRNKISGAGTSADKGQYDEFTPTFITNRTELQTIYVESWAAKSFINIKIDDMFPAPRIIISNQKDAYNEYLHDFNVTSLLQKSMKLGKLMGSAFMVFITKEAPLDTPLNTDLLMRGDLQNILVLDRFDCSTVSLNKNIYSKNYGKPDLYTFTIKSGGTFNVHPSRVIRFDGIESLSSEGWQGNYDYLWGVSDLVPVLVSIFQEAGIAGGIKQLIDECSIPTVKIRDFKDILKNKPKDELEIDELAQEIRNYKSIYSLMLMDVEDDFSRTEVSFSGLPQVYDRYAIRLAAAAGVPVTRFFGKSPDGFNATGEGDLRNYAQEIKSEQEAKLRPSWRKIDAILSKTSGIDVESDFEFPSIIDQSDNERSSVLSTTSTALSQLVNAEIIDEVQAADYLRTSGIMKNLSTGDFSFSGVENG